jgi:two-component system sensor histidine kinase/response regulator
MELMGGEIGVESRPGEGSTFWIKLPVTFADAVSTGNAAATVERKQNQTHRWTVLYIEDDEVNKRLVERILAMRKDIKLLCASSANLGMELAVAKQPSLIVMDTNLLEKNGHSILASLRDNAATRQIPVVAITSDARPQKLEAARAAGISAYIPKPLDINDLIQTLDDLLQ